MKGEGRNNWEGRERMDFTQIEKASRRMRENWEEA